MDNGKLTVDNEVSSGMKFRYRNEDEMKDSEVEWIGKIPKDWDIIKIKYVSPIGRGASPRPIDDEKYFDDNGEYSWTRIADVSISGKYLLETSQKMSKLGSSFSVKLQPGSLFISIAGTVGKPCITQIKACIHDGFIYFHGLKEEYIDFLYNIFSVGECYAGLGKLGTQLNLNRETIGNIYIPNPNSNIKEKISKFISKKTAQFDSIISKKEVLIKRLEEAKKSLISEVVTGKLKVVKTFDGYELLERKKEEMKDSGVEWFNKVPKDWKYSKLKYLTNQIIDGTHTTPNYIDSGIPFLRVTDITNNSEKIDKEKVKYISIEEHKELIKRCKPENGDLLVSKNGTIGITKAIDWEWEFSIFVSLCLIKVKKELLSDLLSLFFKSNILDEQIAYGGKKTSITNLHLEKIREFVVPVPQLEEQQLIVNYLKRVCRNLDNNINKRLLEIEKLKEAKQSLISEAVTGKIEILD